MKVGTYYIVTKPSDDGTFEVGDRIQLMDDGAILCVQARGWVDREDVKEAIQGMNYEVDTEYIEQRKADLLKKICRLMGIDG
jgi:ABC-type sugar transport system ATPase subunit